MANNLIIERYNIYQSILEQNLEFSCQNYNPAPMGDYEFSLDTQQHCIVTITEKLAAIGQQYADNIPSISLTYNRQIIQVSLEDLIKKGHELHNILGYDAGDILQKSTYWDLKKHQKTQEITINEVSHLLGPTGSGKSTFIECLVSLLIEQNKRIAIATNSVGEVQDWLKFAQKVGIKAVPIIGRSERHQHLSRLNQAIMFSDPSQPFDHPGFAWLSQACPLLSFTTSEIVQAGGEKQYKPPCFGRLKENKPPSKKQKEPKKYDCPLVGICPRHINPNTLQNAQLIVGTLPGFIHQRVTPQSLTENITFLEYLALTTDLLIIDEVDLAQPKLDDLFYPITPLESFDPVRDTWTREESYNHVNGVLEGASVVLGNYRDSYLEKSEDQRQQANISISRLMYLMRNIEQWLKRKKPDQSLECLLNEYVNEGRLFASWSLFDRLAKQLSGLAKLENSTQKIRENTRKKRERIYQKYREIFKRIEDNPTDPNNTGLNQSDSNFTLKLALLSGNLLAGDFLQTLPHPQCLKFIQETSWEIPLEKIEEDQERFTESLAILLQMAIYSTQLLGSLGKHYSARKHSSNDPPNRKIHIIRIRDNYEVPQAYGLFKAEETFEKEAASFAQGIFLPSNYQVNDANFTQTVLSISQKPQTSKSKIKTTSRFEAYTSKGKINNPNTEKHWKAPQPRAINILATPSPSEFYLHHGITHKLRDCHWWTADEGKYPLPLALAEKLKEWCFNDEDI